MKEQVIEDRLLKQLAMLGYEQVTFNNSFTMKENIKRCLNKINNRDFDDSDIDKILRKIDSDANKTVKYAYTFNEIIENGIYLQLKSEERVTRDNKPYIRVFDTTCVQNNVFQVAHQITDNGNQSSRYDVTILINGFPIIQIELKRADVEIDEAINQINRYINTAFTGLFKYVQLYIVSNDTQTKYGVNTNQKINKLFMFNWSDEKNQSINNLIQFTDSFLTKQNVFDMITKFMVRYKTGSGKMIVLRPYQIYAIKSAIKKVTIPANAKTGRDKNGYIFHTTGSGKTLTSWKCVSLMKDISGVDKVVFLVDRKDLDSQTTAEFKSIDANFDVNDTPNTYALQKNWSNIKNKIIITTIQKLSIAIKKAESGDRQYEATFGSYMNKRVIFVIDECHRTQYGEMHRSIERFFTNSLYIGFTGTPLYDENKGANGITTKEMFGEEIHTYRIKDAIKDRNVLGFSIDYYNTVSGNELLTEDKTLAFDNSSIDCEEVLMNPTRISNIVRKIADIHSKKTQGRKYTALFAVQSIDMLLAYYEEFKKYNETLDDEHKLNVSAVFTASDSETEKEQLSVSHNKSYMSIMDDFNAMMGTSCKADDSFRAELVKGLRGATTKHLDIVIVVGIFLTGFDSPATNTLYIDKSLEWHNLLQAFSRTNRVETDSKPFGNIVCFRNLKVAVDEAISLFNYGKDNNDIIAKSYESVFADLIKAIDELLPTLTKDLALSEQSEETKERFVKAMREVNKALNEVKQFSEFTWDKIEDKLPADTYQALVGQMKEIKAQTESSGDTESALSYIDFCMELVEEDKIDLDYIKNLINNIDLSSFESLQQSANEIIKVMEKSNSDSLVYKKDLIKKFLNKLILDSKESLVVSDEQELIAYFRHWVIQTKQDEIEEKASELNMSVDEVDTEVLKQSVTGKVDEASISDKVRVNNTKANLREKRTLRESFSSFVSAFTQRFSDLF